MNQRNIFSLLVFMGVDFFFFFFWWIGDVYFFDEYEEGQNAFVLLY